MWADMHWYNNYRRLGIPESDWHDANVLYRDAVRAYPIALFAGVREMLVALAPTHTQVIVSNQNLSEIRARLEGFGIGPLFAQIYANDGAPIDKAAAFEQAMREHDVEPSRTTAIGDYPSDIAAARAARVGLVLASGYSWPSHELLLESCAQAGVVPDRVAATPADIVTIVREKMA